MKNKLFYLFILASIAFLPACKKDKPDTSGDDKPPASGSTFDKIRDSVFLYAKEAYLWNDALPSYKSFNPRSFTGGNEFAALQKEVDVISQFKINPATGEPYEYDPNNRGGAKYSFIDEGETADVLNGNRGDFGFSIDYRAANDLRVTYVYETSPADLKGMHRGDQIIEMNGRTSLNGTNQGDVDFLNAAYSGNSLSMTLKRADGGTYDVAINRTRYSFNPVLKETVLNVGNGKKIGYIVFNSFTSPENATVYLDRAFEEFTTENITDLVVDLRYNGGGYVSTAEYLANLIVPPSKNGSLMYNTYYNSLLTSGKADLLKNQWRIDPADGESYNYGQLNYTVASNATNFSKKGSLNISRVFFIVSDATASASELVINNLTPMLNVQLVGTTTYGKPVGFFDININKYQLYIPEFVTKNSQNKGDYYSGMQPGSSDYAGFNAPDDISKDFGDPQEGLLASVISYVTKGTYAVATARVESLNARKLFTEQQEKLDRKLEHKEFKGMIMDHPGKR